MFQVDVIGSIAAAATKLSSQGREFVSFRVAHNDRYTDASGQRHESVVWVDCILNDVQSKVIPFLTTGTSVFVRGSATLRVYSSAKERCMKAGISISVRHVELLGTRGDSVPAKLYDTEGVEHRVDKFYNVADVRGARLMSQRGALFLVDENGWVSAPPANFVEQQPSNPQPIDENE